MSKVRVGPGRKQRGRRIAITRGGAVSDAVPEVQPSGRLKRVRKTDESVAESEEDDD